MASMENLFDDDDSSDEDMPSTQPPPPGGDAEADTDAPAASEGGDSNSGADSAPEPAPAVTKNSQLFGSDSDSSDDDEAAAAPEATTTTTTTDTTNDADNAKDPTKSNVEKDSDDDEDVEFNADDITGKKAAPKPKTFDNADGEIGQQQPSRHITVPDLPLSQFVQAKDPTAKTSFHIAQLPRIITIQSDAFDRDSYNASVEDAEFNKDGGSGHSSMIRWRFKRDESGEYVLNDEGKKIKESNTKIIKWSDGTYGLCVGDEVFNMNENSFQIQSKVKGKGKVQNGGPNNKDSQQQQQKTAPKKFASRDYIYLTQKAQALDEDSGTSKPIGTILQCVTSLKSKFIPRPASLQSAAHKRFVLRERQRVMEKRAQIAEHVTFEDPEKQKAERIRHKDDLMKQEKRSGGGGRRSTGGGRRRYGMSRSYLEDDDEHYDSVNIRSLKRGTMNDDDMDYGDDILSDEDEWSRRKRKRSRKSEFGNDDDDDDSDGEEEMVVDDDEDEEEEQIAVRKRANARSETKKSAAIFDDSDSD